jgi:hypothetical protein
VGNAFVNQYYNILHQSPEHVHRFYQDASRLGRPAAGAAADAMDTVTTMDVSSSSTRPPRSTRCRGPDLGGLILPDRDVCFSRWGRRVGSDLCFFARVRTVLQAINDKIVSMGITRAEIKAVDAQESLCGGVTVLVMGHLTGRTDVGREFVQSFFLAPQEKGYFVLNDILRYVGEREREEEGAGHPAPPPAPATVPEVVDAEAATPVAVLANGTVVRGADIESVPREQGVTLSNISETFPFLGCESFV